MAELVSMKRSPAEKKAEEKTYLESSPESESYPWGLRLNLSETELDKLGIGALKVGDTLRMEARVRICSASEYQSEGGGQRRSAELLITDMALSTDAGEKKDAAAVLYGAQG